MRWNENSWRRREVTVGEKSSWGGSDGEKTVSGLTTDKGESE